MIFGFPLFSFLFNNIGVFKSWTAWKTEVLLLIWHRIQTGGNTVGVWRWIKHFPDFIESLNLGFRFHSFQGKKPDKKLYA